MTNVAIAIECVSKWKEKRECVWVCVWERRVIYRSFGHEIISRTQSNCSTVSRWYTTNTKANKECEQRTYRHSQCIVFAFLLVRVEWLAADFPFTAPKRSHCHTHTRSHKCFFCFCCCCCNSLWTSRSCQHDELWGHERWHLEIKYVHVHIALVRHQIENPATTLWTSFSFVALQFDINSSDATECQPSRTFTEVQ